MANIYNPFRYRGYYYDVETELYYLQSRYYNPAWGRFINADGYVNANGDILGYNMYAYCGNNPVMYVDFSGEAICQGYLNINGVYVPLGDTIEGIMGPYNELRKIAYGYEDFEVHHLVEKRFYLLEGFGRFNRRTAPSVIVRKETHQAITNSTRQKFPYKNSPNYDRSIMNLGNIRAFYKLEYGKGGRSGWFEAIDSLFF